MPAAARLTDPTAHAAPLSPGPGSADVDIGFLPAWRALPQSMGAGVESALTTMKELIDSLSLVPASTPAKLAKVAAGLSQDAMKAARLGSPGAPAAVAGGFASLTATNAALTATYAAAAAVPGGEPAARAAYTQGIKAAAAAFAAAAMNSVAGMTDKHICPQPAGPIPHGPGVVTKGSQSVFINNLPACRQGDTIFESAGGADAIKKGDPSVLIGDDLGSPASDTALDTAAVEQAVNAQAAVAALLAAAASAAPLIELCPNCPTLLDAARDRTHRVGFRVVINQTGEPVPGVALTIALPDGTIEQHRTDADGRVEIDDLDVPGLCTVSCDLRAARMQETFHFITLGDMPMPTIDDDARQRARIHPKTEGIIALVEEHKVKTGETIESLARSCGLSWQELARFNWGTSIPNEINYHLRDFVGCTKRTRDGHNYIFDSADEPGIVYLPRTWSVAGLATDLDHTIRVRAPRSRTRRLIVALLDDQDQPRPNIPYALEVGEARFEARTDPRGRIDHYIPVGHAEGCLTADGRQITLLLNQLEPVEEVIGAQKRLNNLGYDAGPEGELNKQTARAVREFQERHNLESTGELTAETRARLKDVYGH